MSGLRFIGASLCRKPSARGCDGKERLVGVKEELADLQKNQKEADRKIDILKDRMLFSEKHLKDLRKNLDLAEEELKLKCDIAGLAREGVTEKAAAILITKKESLLTDIKKTYCQSKRRRI